MANKKNVTVEAQIDQEIEAAVDKTQDFFDKNGKTITYVLIAIVAVVAAIFGYQKFVKEPRAEKAAAAMYMAQFRFEGENADYELALNGDEEGAGFLDVIEQYGSTPAGNLAAQYAGICYMKLGDWDNAEKYLAQYKATKGVPNAVVNAENLGLQGDVKVQKGDYKKAAALFEQAAAVADNNFTTPLYLKKAALAYEATGDTAAALKTYKRIANEYAASVEARDAEKMLGQE
jgi:tetratricopeptide (TPR) repeat protein